MTTMNRPVRDRVSRWRLKGFPDATALSGHEAAVVLNQRLAWATFETWFEGDDGRLLAVITNGDRAMVMLLTDEGDPGEHAIDPGARGGVRRLLPAELPERHLRELRHRGMA
jgi:hypothetical protein